MRVPTRLPAAAAYLNGGEKAPELTGIVKFYPMRGGVLVTAEVTGLPASEAGFFALHIHAGGDCGGAAFADTQGHYNPAQLPHPRHAGDLPPLLRLPDASAFLAAATGRFSVPEIVGKTVVIHALPDDFHTQPSGASGDKLACGVIRPLTREA